MLLTWRYLKTTLLALALLAITCQVWAGEKVTLTLSTADYLPLAGERLPYGGILTRIVSESFRRSGIDVKYISVANNRAITGVMLGIYDGSYGWARNKERDSKLLYSRQTIWTNRMLFLQRHGESHPWKRLDDLSTIKIGVTLGDHYSDEFSRLQADGILHVDLGQDDVTGVRKLLAGRVDLFPMEVEAAQFLLVSNFSPEQQAKIAIQPQEFAAVPVYFVLRKSLPQAEEIMERFNIGFQQLKKTGELDRLVKDTREEIFKHYNASKAP